LQADIKIQRADVVESHFSQKAREMGHPDKDGPPGCNLVLRTRY
jgi:hypothetical protein